MAHQHPASGVASAIGLLAAPVSLESLRTYRIAISELSAEDFITRFAELENAILSVISHPVSHEDEDDGKPDIVRRLDMRYLGQGFELEINLPCGIDMKSLYASLPDLFHDTYEKHFFTRFPDRDMEIINWKTEITVAGAMPVDNCMLADHETEAEALTGVRNVYSHNDNRYVGWPVYNRYALRQGDKFTGPMLIEERASTAVIHEDDIVEIDNRLNLVVTPALTGTP